jgi:hypothetical protein
MTRRNLLAVVATGVLAMVGCGPAKQTVERTFALSAETPAKTYELPAQSAALAGAFSSTYTSTELSAVTSTFTDCAAELDEKDLKAKAAASKAGTKAETLSVQVPAGQAVTVWVGRSGVTQKATGTLKMTN